MKEIILGIPLLIIVTAQAQTEIATICSLKDGQKGFTSIQATTGAYAVYNKANANVNVPIQRRWDCIEFKGNSRRREAWGCTDEPGQLKTAKDLTIPDECAEHP